MHPNHHLDLQHSLLAEIQRQQLDAWHSDASGSSVVPWTDELVEARLGREVEMLLLMMDLWNTIHTHGIPNQHYQCTKNTL